MTPLPVLLGVAVVLLAATGASATDKAGGSASTAVGFASATVVNPMTVQPLRDLNFGTLTVGQQTSGVVVIIPGENQAYYGGSARSICGAGCALPHAARFAVSGEAGRRYSIVVSAANESSSALQISAIRIKTGNRSGGNGGGQLNFLGEDQFDLGGTLEVPAGLAPAHYQAILPVTMAYD